MTTPSPSIEYFIQPHLYVERGMEVGKRLIILAEADEGPLFEPVLVYDTDMANEIFKDGRLPELYRQATLFGGLQDMYLMRTDGIDYDTAFVVLESLDFELIYIDSLSLDTDYELIVDLLKTIHSKQEGGNLIHLITTLKDRYTFEGYEALAEKISDLTVETMGEIVEYGSFLSVVIDQMDNLSAGAVYAGMLSSLDPQVSPINKRIPDVTLSEEFTKEEILRLREIGLVCFRDTFKNGVTCTSSSAAVSTPGSVDKHISNFRIAQTLINEMSSELSRLIGSSNLHIQYQNAEDILESILLQSIREGRIRDYDFWIDTNDQAGTIDIDIEVVPIFSVQKIKAHSRVRVFK